MDIDKLKKAEIIEALLELAFADENGCTNMLQKYFELIESRERSELKRISKEVLVERLKQEFKDYQESCQEEGEFENQEGA